MHLLNQIWHYLFNQQAVELRIDEKSVLVPVTSKRITKRKSNHMPYL